MRIRWIAVLLTLSSVLGLFGCAFDGAVDTGDRDVPDGFLSAEGDGALLADTKAETEYLNVAEVDEEGEPLFQIVYNIESSQRVQEQCEALAADIYEETGIELPVVHSSEQQRTYEITVGSIARRETVDVIDGFDLAETDFAICVVGTRVVIYADSEEMNGFAAWIPFGFTGNKTMPFLMNGGFKLILHSGPRIIGRLLAYETYAMNLKKEITGHYDWYLYNLSIKKDAQGKGIASKLMRPMLNFCDDERMVAYLETNKESNVSLYNHYGFTLKKEEVIPKTTVTHYAMVRQPNQTK